MRWLFSIAPGNRLSYSTTSLIHARNVRSFAPLGHSLSGACGFTVWRLYMSTGSPVLLLKNKTDAYLGSCRPIACIYMSRRCKQHEWRLHLKGVFQQDESVSLRGLSQAAPKITAQHRLATSRW